MAGLVRLAQPRAAASTRGTRWKFAGMGSRSHGTAPPAPAPDGTLLLLQEFPRTDATERRVQVRPCSSASAINSHASKARPTARAWFRTVSWSNDTNRPSSTTIRPPTITASTSLPRAECTRLVTIVRGAAGWRWSRSSRTSVRSAGAPGCNGPLYRPSASAPPWVAMARIVVGGSTEGSTATPLWSKDANFMTSNTSSRLFALAPSVPRATRTPSAYSAGTGATPEPSFRLACGQWTTWLPLSRRRARSRSSTHTQWASTVRGPSAPSARKCSTGLRPVRARVLSTDALVSAQCRWRPVAWLRARATPARI